MRASVRSATSSDKVDDLDRADRQARHVLHVEGAGAGRTVRPCPPPRPRPPRRRRPFRCRPLRQRPTTPACPVPSPHRALPDRRRRRFPPPPDPAAGAPPLPAFAPPLPAFAPAPGSRTAAAFPPSGSATAAWSTQRRLRRGDDPREDPRDRQTRPPLCFPSLVTGYVHRCHGRPKRAFTVRAAAGSPREQIERVPGRPGRTGRPGRGRDDHAVAVTRANVEDRGGPCREIGVAGEPEVGGRHRLHQAAAVHEPGKRSTMLSEACPGPG